MHDTAYGIGDRGRIFIPGIEDITSDQSSSYGLSGDHAFCKFLEDTGGITHRLTSKHQDWACCSLGYAFESVAVWNFKPNSLRGVAKRGRYPNDFDHLVSCLKGLVSSLRSFLDAEGFQERWDRQCVKFGDCVSA